MEKINRLNAKQAASQWAARTNKLAGQEGLEPPTCGFGDRRSTNWSYWPIYCLILASFFMQCVMSTPFAIFLELNAIGIILLVLLGRIVTALALGACQSDQSTHEFSFITEALGKLVIIHMNFRKARGS